MKKNQNTIRDGSPIVTFMFYFAATILGFITIYPMYYVIVTSISDPLVVLKKPAYFIPSGLYFGTYKLIVGDMDMWRSYGYTIFYTAAGTILMLVTSVMGAYPLYSKKLFGRKYVVWYLLIPMYFGGGMIPAFLNINKLNMYNTIWAIIIPGAVGIFNIILVRTFFTTIPDSLRESAEIDGAGVMTILRHIYIPLSKPVLAVIAIYTIVGKWNDWFSAMVYLPNTKLHPLQMYLQRIVVAQTVDIKSTLTSDQVEEALRTALSAQQLKYAMIVFVTLPIIIVYPMFQKHFVKGIMLGSLKG